MAERFVTFECRGDTLAAILHEPAGPTRSVAILVIVGGPQYRVGSHRQFVLMARRFAEAGYPVLRFDYRGMGDSSGRSRTFEEVGDDVRAAVHFLEALPGMPSRVVVFGLCDAASVAMMHCSILSGVYGLILANPWARTEAGEARTHVRHYYGQRLLQRSFWSKVLSGKLDVLGSLQSFAATWQRTVVDRKPVHLTGPSAFVARMTSGFDTFGGPVLLVMSGRDLTAREFDDMCRASRQWSILVSRPTVTRVDLPAADHTFSTAGTLEAASAAILAWLREKCDLTHVAPGEPAPPGRRSL